MEHWRVVNGGTLASTVKCRATRTTTFPLATMVNFLCAHTLLVVGQASPMIAQVRLV